MKRYRLIVSGRVQGVGFRYHAAMLASKYNITGYVKNLNDGDVELEAQGSLEALLLFIKDLQHGNRFIKITSIKKEDKEIINKEKGFKILY